MIVFAWYLLKVLIVSGILCGYYFIALKDKVFHKWNRFYLLFTIVLSLLLPFVSIDVLQSQAGEGTVIKVLQSVTMQDEIVIELGKKSLLTTDTLIIAAYILISLIFIATLLLTFLRIYRIRRSYPITEVEGINFINTDAKGTPFSFFNSIFWNRSIDLHSSAGQQIFNHEIAHVKEKHTHDKLFINVVLLFFWINPFFWLIRKELNMIHEFIADKIALEDSDISAFAEMILSSVYPGQQFSITNNFFYSPIKRRLLMLSKNKNSKVNYVSRILVLPLAAIVFMAFAIKMKTVKPSQIYNGEPITVIIDAGHGGSDNGAISQGIKEKDLTLAIAKEIKDFNTNKNINIILSRDHDQHISVKDKVNFAIEKNADLFVSIHINFQMGGKSENGLNVAIPKDDNVYLSQSKLLGSSIVQSFKNNSPLKISDKLIQLNIGAWVLKANKYPAVLIQAGYLTSQKDLSYLSNKENQKTIARNILKGIENYAKQESSANSKNVSDTIPYIETIGAALISPPDEIQIKAEKLFSTTFPQEKRVDPMKAVLIINGKIVLNETLRKKWIVAKRVTLYPGDKPGLINKYGDKAKNGVIVFEDAIIKNTPPQQLSEKSSNGNGIVFTKVEQEAQFPGGQQTWSKYITRQIIAVKDTFTEKDFGTCVVKFIVDKYGKVSDVAATTMKGTNLARVSVDAIKKGPRWIPAMQNGLKVNAYRLQPVTLYDPDNK